MSALLSVCCCDDTATCCSCSLASSYSVAVSLSYDSETFGNTGSPQTYVNVESAYSFTGLAVTEDSTPCSIGSYPNFPAPVEGTWAQYQFSLPSTLTMSAVASVIDSSFCPNTLETNLAGTVSGVSSTVGMRPGLVCVHEINTSKSLDIFFWNLSVQWNSDDLCSSGTFPGPEYSTYLMAYSTPQSTCHAPPSTGWSFEQPTDPTTDAYKSNLITGYGRVEDCYFVPSWPRTCEMGSLRNQTNRALTVTIT